MARELNINIRRFEAKDREALRRIAHDTALLGEPAALFFEGREVFSDALTLYFTDYEPESCFVAEVSSEIAGYLTGARDKKASEKIFKDKIAFGLFCKAIASGILLRGKNIIFLFNCLSDIIKGRLISPDFTGEYPATLHINVSRTFRGNNIGTMLMTRYLDYLKEAGVSGAHLATMSEESAKFFAEQGFKLLYSGKRSYFRHVLQRDIPLYIYGKKLL